MTDGAKRIVGHDDQAATDIRRASALARYAILDTVDQREFDDIAVIASEICAAPISFISFIDGDRQWNKARVGADVREMPRKEAFCNHTVRNGAFLQIPDATRHPDFSAFDAVRGPHAIRFYAGAPILSSDGVALGAVCVLDVQPRMLGAGQERALQALARQVSAMLEMRRQVIEGEAERRELGEWQAQLRRDSDIIKEQAARTSEQLDTVREQLHQAQKMEAIGQLAGGIAHDFNNMLTGVTGSLDLMKVRIAQGRMADVPRYVDLAQEAAARAAALTHRLLAFSRRQTLADQPTDVDALVRNMTELVRRTTGSAITVETNLDARGWMAHCDPGQLENAVLNLCLNGRDAMGGKGLLTVTTEAVDLSPEDAIMADVAVGRYVRIGVTDEGCGMTPEVLAEVFKPFFTTKPEGQGTGLGLSTIYGFARRIGGQVTVRSEPGQGTVMHLLLPRHLDESDEGDAS